MGDHIDIMFDGPSAPKMPRLVEVVDANGRRFNIGDWIERPRWDLGAQNPAGRVCCPIRSGCSVS